MQHIVGVRFHEVGKIHYLVYKGKIFVNDVIIAQTNRGVESGKVLLVKPFDKHEEKNLNPSEKIIRKATEEDIESLKEKRKAEEEAEKICEQKIKEHKLHMKLIEAEYMFNRGKIIFYFVSESRVDFRNLVKELARIFKARIELRQIGTRDEAKMRGGLGACGRRLCCSTFLKDFESVSIKMAKDQNMSLNPVKLSGVCGKLMCCLNYEEDVYRSILSKMPKIGANVVTPFGKGAVVSQNVLKESVEVEIKSDEEMSETYSVRLNELKKSH